MKEAVQCVTGGFSLVRFAKFGASFGSRVEVHVDLAVNVFFTVVGHVERQHVGEVIVLEIAAVQVQDRVVIGQDDLQVGYGGVFGAKDRKSTRLNSSHVAISYAVFCLKK